MDDNIRYTFCIEMATLSKQFEDLDGMNEWYSRAWHYLHKASDDSVRLQDFPIIKDKRDA